MKHSLLAVAALLFPLTAQAQVFEVIHPDVEEGGFEFEVINTVIADGIAVGEERSVHEIAIGYAPVSFWKTTIAFEVATVRGNGSVLEAFEWENVFLFPLSDHDHDHDHGGSFGLEAIGIYAAVEVPREGGISAGGFAFGPVAELALGPVHSVANLFVEIPQSDGEDPGLAYALSASVPVFETGSAEFEAGFEAHGGVEGLFGSNTTPLGQSSHVLGPAFYAGFDVGEGQEIEPRLAVLFGLTDGSPDAAISFNIEFKY
ncbi:MAG: hypothetical protein AB8B85_12730 [Paracoccaceae bacterium]